MLLLFLSFSAPEDMAPNRFGCETGQLEYIFKYSDRVFSTEEKCVNLLQRCAAHSPHFGMTPLESAFDGGERSGN
jgi:hypothetical protein